MKNYLEEGSVVPYTIPSSTTIVPGDVVIIGKMIGIAKSGGTEADVISVCLEGVYELPKDAPLVITKGDKVFWSVANSEVTKTVTDVPLGIAWASAVSAATTVEVRLSEDGNIVPVTAVIAALGTTSNLVGVDGTGSNAAPLVGTEARLDAIEAKVDALIAAMKTSGAMATA